MKAIILSAKNSIPQPSLRRGSLLMPLLLVCFGLAPMAQAVGPDTEGAIPGSNNGEGIGVLVSRTGGIWNTGTGFEALNHLTSGNQNTATGLRALASDTNGGFNTATGVFSLFSNTSGFFNTATGAYSLANNTTGLRNTATGYGALYRNNADANTAMGFGALYRNTTGGTLNTTQGFDVGPNTAVGAFALGDNTISSANTAVGYQALGSITTGIAGTDLGLSTAVGFQALANATGDSAANDAFGYQALFSLTSGINNTAIGARALFNNTTGSGNIALGVGAGTGVTTADNVIAIGALGEDVSNTCYIRNIFGVTSAGATGVVVNSAGKLGTVVSSRRFKDDIKPMDQASEALFALKPVSFHYKKEIDPESIPQFGLVAEDVEKVNPDLVVRDAEGKVNTVRYDAVNAMLLNEFLKEHRTVEKQSRKVQEQEATIAQLKQDFQSKLAEQDKQIKMLTAGLQEMSARLAAASPSYGGFAVSKAAPHMVVNK
jgi:hypothetical protein